MPPKLQSSAKGQLGRKRATIKNGVRSVTGGKVWFVSRHPGALAWAREEGIEADLWVEHLNPALVARGDTVIGTLPAHVAAQVCRRGARYLHLAMHLRRSDRGRELDARALREAGARLEPLHVVRRGGGS